MGVWNISYTTVSCEDDWAGANNAAAVGSVPNLGDSVCCPLDPVVRSSFSLSPSPALITTSRISSQAHPDTACPSIGAAPNTSSSGGGSGGPGSAIGHCGLVPTQKKGSPLAVIILLCFTVACSIMVHAFIRIEPAI